MNPETKFANRADRIWRLIRSQPGITKRELSLHTHTVSAVDRNAVLDHLIEQAKIREQVERTPGRYKTTYWPATQETPQQTHGEARCGDDGLCLVRLTPSEVKRVNEARRAQNAILERCGKPALPLLPSPQA